MKNTIYKLRLINKMYFNNANRIKKWQKFDLWVVLRLTLVIAAITANLNAPIDDLTFNKQQKTEWRIENLADHKI